MLYTNATPFRPRKGNGFRCYFQCPTDFTPDDIRTHTRTAHALHIRSIAKGYIDSVIKIDVKDLQCILCTRALSDLQDFEQHIVSQHNKTLRKDFAHVVVPYKLTAGKQTCQVCGESFAEFSKINSHMHTHYKRHICELCGDGFMTNSLLNKHKQTHTGGHACDICKKSFNTALKLKMHCERVHERKHKLLCSRCPQRFYNHYQKLQHLEDAHDVVLERYGCDQCEKTFKHKISLRNHTRRQHLNERSHSCDICEQTFFHGYDLKNHMLKHTGERNHQCQVCKKKYPRKKTLVEHMKIHNGVRKFVCSSCGLAFVQNCSLKGHIKTHHPDLKS